MKLGHKTSNFSPRFRHPTSDISLRSEHYCYFDDMYSPEFTMQWIYEAIQKHDIDAESLMLCRLWLSFIHKQKIKKLMNERQYKLLEDALLKEADLLIEKSKSQGEKALYNLFKSAILKKYKDQYDVDIQQGEVKKETVDKSRQRRCDKASTGRFTLLEGNGNTESN